MKNVEDLIVESLVNVVNLCCINEVTNTKPSNLVFPVHSNGARRVCEQEARFLFIQAVEQDKQFLYSVEAPTKKKYRFSDDGTPKSDGVPKIDPTGDAGNIDACLYENGERKHLIEFKKSGADQKDYSKDFLKLICDEDNDQLTNYFVQVKETADRGTIPNIEGKYNAALAQAQAQAQPPPLKQSQLVIFLCVMKKREIIRYNAVRNGVVQTWKKTVK